MVLNHLFNRIAIALGLSAFAFFLYGPNGAIVPVLFAVISSALLEYFENQKLSLLYFFTFCILCFFFPQLAIFLPVAAYDILFEKYQGILLIMLLPLGANQSMLSAPVSFIALMFAAIEALLKQKAIKSAEIKNKYIEQTDDLNEFLIRMNSKVHELSQKQDSEINLATLAERNRIAREIHDNVGHLLSSAILQTGAAIAVAKDENTIKSLQTIKDTLNEAMNSIRKSVHDLHDDSIDLYAQLKKLADEFSFCKAIIKYEVNSNMPASYKYAVLAIAKEALANVMKHSNATQVLISIYEHPAIFQIIILDNGTKLSPGYSNSGGMGLESIRQRILGLGGIVNYSYSNGFKIFISLPKNQRSGL